METILTKYKKLFQVEVLLHHLLDEGTTLFDNLNEADRLKKLSRYDLRRWMTIEPTAPCREALAGLGWVFKTIQTGMVVATAAEAVSESEFKPAIPPSASLTLDFEMLVNDGSFGSFSAFQLPGKLEGQRAVYLFDNQAAHAGGVDFPALTLNPPVFSLAVEYLPGDIVRNQGKKFQAKQKTLGNSTTDTAFWVEITGSLNYANAAQIQSKEDVPVSNRAFALLRIHCSEALGDFSLFGAGKLKSPAFKIRLKKLTT